MKNINKYFKAGLVAGGLGLATMICLFVFVIMPIYSLAGMEDQAAANARLDGISKQSTVLLTVFYVLLALTILLGILGVVFDRRRKKRK